MIGDWVIDKAVSDRPVQVMQINDRSVHYKHGNGYISVGIELLDPVPLTPEILERNGFSKMDMKLPRIDGQHEWVYWQNMSSSVCLWTRELYDDTKEGWALRIEAGSQSITIVVWHVHELQHALRMCGIDKEMTIMED